MTDAARDADGEIRATLDEFRLDATWWGIRGAATSQALAEQLAASLGVSRDDSVLSVVVPQMWHDRGVTTDEALDVWMKERRLDPGRLRELVAGEALRRWGEDLVGPAIPHALLDQCQLSAEYPRLRARALDKRTQLAERGLLDLPRAVDLDYQELLTWWSRHRPHLAPSQLVENAQQHPFANDAEFRQAVINEYHYVTRCHPRGETSPGCGRLQDSDMVSVAEPSVASTGPSPWDRLGDLGAFASCCWNRRPSHYLAADAFTAESIIGLSDIDRLITSRQTDVHLLERGVYLSDDGHREGGLVRPDRRTWLSDPAAVIRDFRGGRSIVIPSINELWAPIDVLAKELEARLGVSVDAMLFVSPVGSRTDWHADNTHSLVLQLYGRKQWLIECDGPAGTTQVNAPLIVDLAPGDVVYVPRQFMHEVRVSEGVSIHLTFRCSMPSRLDVARAALAGRFHNRSEWSLDVGPVSPTRGPLSQDRWTEQSQQLIDDLGHWLQRLDGEALAAAVPVRRHRSLPQAGAFLKAYDAMSVTSDSAVRCRPGHHVSLEEASERVTLRFSNRCLQLPAWLSPAVRVLLDNAERPLTPLALPIDAADAVVLVRRLVAEGMLETCRHNTRDLHAR